MKKRIKNYLNTIKYLFRYYCYRYDENKYRGTFLTNFPYTTQCEFKPIPKVIYIFWTGDNPLTENRVRNLEILKTLTGVKIELITPNNLSDFILPNYPLHPAYEYLSFNHRSDYLRCYFMHHYGGGYSDIKACQHSWLPMFEKLEKSSAWLIGYPEIRKGHLGAWSLPTIRQEMEKYFPLITGNGCYICRPNSPITQEWYAELHRRLDEKYELAKQNPGNMWGDNAGYPFEWTELGGDIVHPIVFKYMKFTIKDKRLRPILVDYR